MARVLVTGGSGKLGRAVLKDLVTNGYSVLNLDQALPREAPCPTVRVDLADFGQVLGAMLGVDEHGGLFPQSEIHRTWQWNLHKAQREAALEQRGIDRFVPTRMYARVEGQAETREHGAEHLHRALEDVLVAHLDPLFGGQRLCRVRDEVIVRSGHSIENCAIHGACDPD